MGHSANFEKVKNFYNMGLWDKIKVKNAVGRWITQDEYYEITGDIYEP